MVDSNDEYIADAIAENARELKELGLEGDLPTRMRLEMRRELLNIADIPGGIGQAVHLAEVKVGLDLTPENVSRVIELKKLQKEMSENS